MEREPPSRRRTDGGLPNRALVGLASTREGRMSDEAGEKKSIWQWVLLATLLAIALACAAGVLLGDEVTTREQYIEKGHGWTDLVEGVVALAIAVTSALLFWLVFFVIIFRKRSRLWKSMVALLAMVLVVTLVSLPVRVGTFLYYWDQDNQTLREIRSNLSTRLVALRTESEQRGHALRADRGLPALRSEVDITNAQAAVREQREQISAFEENADRELQQARQQTLELEVYEGEREEALAKLEEILAPDSATHRLFRLEHALLDKQEEALVFLLQHRSSWSFYEREIQFHDREDLNRMNAIMSEAYAIIPQIDVLEGRGGEGVARAQLPGE
jgi:hypothetical protein